MVEPIAPDQIIVQFLKRPLWPSEYWGEFSIVDFLFQDDVDDPWAFEFLDQIEDNDWIRLRKLES